MAHSYSSLSDRPYSETDFQRNLELFQDYIDEITLKGSEESPEERRQTMLDTLRYDQFTERIRSIFGEDVKASHIKNVFKKISNNPDADIDWSEIFGYDNSYKADKIVEKNENGSGKKDKNEVEVKDKLKAVDEVQVFVILYKFTVGDASGDKARRDVLQSIVHAADIDCLITASQKGAITVWNKMLKIQACMTLNEKTDGWASGCCYMPNLKKVSISSEKYIFFWDPRQKLKSANDTPMLMVMGPILTPITCIDCTTELNQEFDTVIVGDAEGHIMSVRYSVNNLTYKNSKRDANHDSRFMLQLQHFMKYWTKRKIHDSVVLKVKYVPELKSIISCCADSKNSLAFEDLDKFQFKDIRTTKYLSIEKGVNAFVYCKKARFIVTGGVDKVLRVFNPILLSKPIGKLLGHVFTITDIICNEKDQQLISLSAERVFRVWDISNLKCLQVFTDSDDRTVEKRIYAVIFDDRRERMYTGSTLLECWPVAKSVQDSMQQPRTHDKPIISSLYNSTINQIATLCSSELKVWEAETGKLTYSINDVNGKDIELTCMCLDASGYRLATGAVNGSIKIWDFGAGQELKHKRGKKNRGDLNIFSMTYTKIQEELFLVVTETNNKIKIYKDSSEDKEIQFLKSFNDQIQVTDEIFAISRFNGRRLREKSKTKSGLTLTRKKSNTFISRALSKPNENQSITNSNSFLEAPKSGKTQSSSQETQSLLKFHEIQCVEYHPETNIFLTGGATGELVFWDNHRNILDKVSVFPEDYTPSSQVKRSLAENHSVPPNLAEPLRRVNCIHVFVHKTHKFEIELPPNTSVFGENIELGSRAGSKLRTSRMHSTMMSKQNTEILDQTFNGSEVAPVAQSRLAQFSRMSRMSKMRTELELNGNDDDNNNENNNNKPKAVTRVVDIDYPLMIATGHDDSTVRFWNENGELLHELIPPAAFITGAACTAICTDVDANHLYTADSRGYLTMWSIAQFVENLETSQNNLESREQNKNSIGMLVSWKAHTNRINSIVYVSINKTLITVSVDESARIWWGSRGRYLGFLAQTKALTIPLDDLSDWNLPYDINEPPTYSTVKIVADKQVLNSYYDYPLVLDRSKFSEPLVLPPITPESPLGFLDSSMLQNKKIYGALMKPKHMIPEDELLTSFSKTPRKDGSVFSSLPLYQQSQSKNADLKLILLSNPYRMNKELSYLSFNRIMERAKKESELAAVKEAPVLASSYYKTKNYSSTEASTLVSRISEKPSKDKAN